MCCLPQQLLYQSGRSLSNLGQHRCAPFSLSPPPPAAHFRFLLLSNLAIPWDFSNIVWVTGQQTRPLFIVDNVLLCNMLTIQPFFFYTFLSLALALFCYAFFTSVLTLTFPVCTHPLSPGISTSLLFLSPQRLYLCWLGREQGQRRVFHFIYFAMPNIPESLDVFAAPLWSLQHRVFTCVFTHLRTSR